MSSGCTHERFERDVRGHQMIVIRADGVNRHLRFKKPGDSSYWFDLITWPGTLCVDGDMGTYVFKRIQDMFEFFRTKSGGINEGYWHEKVVAQSRHGGIEEFDQKAFVRHAVEVYRDYWRDRGEWEGFQFYDVFEWDLKRYTFRYIWNLYAIVWGIQQFDAAQPQELAA